LTLSRVGEGRVRVLELVTLTSILSLRERRQSKKEVRGTMTTDHTATGLIGASIRRVEDPVLVAGKGCYVDDIQLPGMLYLAFLRTTYPHAKIISITTIPLARGVRGAFKQ
jgi:xanthine dehydrogenase molybdopterin-binding subunit B